MAGGQLAAAAARATHVEAAQGTVQNLHVCRILFCDLLFTATRLQTETAEPEEEEGVHRQKQRGENPNQVR